MKYIVLLVLMTSFVFLIQCTPEGTSSSDSEITYLDSGLYGVNILNQERVQFSGNEFSLCVKIPENKSVVVKLFRMQNSGWFVSQSTISNWSVSGYNWSDKSQTFTSVSGNMTSDLKLEMESGQYKIEYYENQESELTFSREIEI